MSFILFTKTLKCFKKEDKIVYKRKINYMRYLLGKQNHKRSHIFYFIINTKTMKNNKNCFKKSEQAHCRQLII